MNCFSSLFHVQYFVLETTCENVLTLHFMLLNEQVVINQNGM